MMGEEIVDVTIGADGRVVVEVQGIGGSDCLEATEDLVALLGGNVESQELTAEAYAESRLDQSEAVHPRPQSRGRP